MSYDLNILSLNQNDASKLPFLSSIELRNEHDFPNLGRYYTIWPYMCSSKGVWYSLGIEDDGYFNAMAIVDADFDKCVKRQNTPYWRSDDEVISNLKPLIVNKEYRIEFEKIIEFLIKQSPNKNIMFLARYQGGEKEIVLGVLKREEFFKLLYEFKILFNVCYIISG